MSGELKDVQGGEREVVEVVGYLLAKAKQLSLMPAGKADEPLMTVAQHERIVAAKDAEIEAIKENAADTIDDLHRELSAIKAQQGASVAVPDVMNRAFITGESGDGEYRVVMQFQTLADMQQSHNWIVRLLSDPSPARLNQQPCAVVMPERKPYENPGSEYFHGYNAGWASALDRIARLNPPVDGVVVPIEFVRFLLGETDMGGYSFGDMHQVRVGKFWWRTELRALLAQQPAPSPVSGLVEALEVAAKAMWSSESNMDNEAAAIESALAAYKAQEGDRHA